jgi:phosphoglycolate phosphatase
MIPNHYSAFIFDMDGTIVSSIEDIAAAVNHSLRLHSLPQRKLEEYITFIGNGSVKLIQRALGPDHQDLFQPVFSDYLAYYDEHCTDVTHPYEGMKESLLVAKEKGILLFVDTNKPQPMALRIVDHCFGKDLFTQVVGIPVHSGDRVKPDPEHFLRATEGYALDFTSVAYFGDSGTDILTAKNLGIPHIYSCAWGYKKKEFLESFTPAPKAILDSPWDIQKVISGTI